MMFTPSKNIFVLVIALLLAAPLAALPQTKVKPGFNLFSPQQDVEIGRQSAAQAEKQLPLLNNAQAAEYLNRLAQRLAAQAPGERYPYQFAIVNASDINAFALPGGPIYVNRGTFEAAQTEAELAGVVAHEIAHVALRHGTNQASKAYLAQAGLGLLGGVLGKGSLSTVIGAVGGFGLNTLFLKYSRDAETQADVIGAQIMARAGYDPRELGNFFDTLQREAKRNPSKLERFFSDHPSPPDRVQRIAREADLLGFRGRSRTGGGFEEIRARLSNMPKAPTLADRQRKAPPANTRPRSYSDLAAVRVAPPAATLHSYRHPQGLYEIAHPDNWRAYATGQDSGVSFMPLNGWFEAEGRAEIIYGALVNIYRPINEPEATSERNLRGGARGAQRRSLAAATNDLATSIRQSNPYLRVVAGASNEARLAGRNGLTVTLLGRSPVYGRDERVTLYTRALNSEIFYVLFIVPDAEYAAYSRTFERMLNSLAIQATASQQ